MVVLNDFLPISILSLKTHISNNIMGILDDNLDYYIETSSIIKKNDKKKLFDNILKEVKNTISSDHFLFLIMDNNYCTHKYKKGKNEGKYCAKKIRSNNPKKVYLCCTHDKNHIPKKKKKNVENIYSTELINDNIIDKNELRDVEKVNVNINYNSKLNNKVIDNFKLNNINDKMEINKKTNVKNPLLDKKDIEKKKTSDLEKKINTIKKNRNHKHKKHKWQKLDILRDTGFIFK
jgi:hypothetical protein